MVRNDPCKCTQASIPCSIILRAHSEHITSTGEQHMSEVNSKDCPCDFDGYALKVMCKKPVWCTLSKDPRTCRCNGSQWRSFQNKAKVYHQVFLVNLILSRRQTINLQCNGSRTGWKLLWWRRFYLHLRWYLLASQDWMNKSSSGQHLHHPHEGGWDRGDRPLHPLEVWDQSSVERKPGKISEPERKHRKNCENALLKSEL